MVKCQPVGLELMAEYGCYSQDFRLFFEIGARRL